ncbi:MAG: copper homeostasis membrane protein CopD [Novosphingobium sp.]
MDEAPLIGTRFALYLALSAQFGLSAFSLYALEGSQRIDAVRVRPWLLGCCGVALLASIASLILLASDLAGAAPWPIDQAATTSLLTDSAFGVAWQIRVAALALIAAIALRGAARSSAAGIIACASGVSLGTLAWAGHGAMDQGASGWVHLGADILHLLAAGVWIGALLALTLLVVRRAATIDAAHVLLTHNALRRFGTVGTGVVAMIVLTGLINSRFLVGVSGIFELPSTHYGQLLLAKLGLFTAMLGLASLNRFVFTPSLQKSISLGNSRAALTALRYSLAIEATAVLVILGLVAWLGTLEPPAVAM